MIKNKYGRNANAGQIKELMGLKPNQSIPAEGLAAKWLTGTKVWADPIQPGKFKLRMMCSCPSCEAVLPVGRLAQHEKACPHTHG